MAAQTQLGWEYYGACIYHTLVGDRPPFGYTTQHNKQCLPKMVVTNHMFFFLGMLGMIDVKNVLTSEI